MANPSIHAHVVLHTNTLPNFMAALKALGDREVLVGYPESTTDRDDEDGLTNAQLAAIQDKGSPAQGIPPGNFMEDGVEEKKVEIIAALKAGATAVLDGNKERFEAALDAAGMAGVIGIKDKIIAGPWKPLADSTIAARQRRGVTRTNRYIDTGQLLNATNYVKRNRRAGS